MFSAASLCLFVCQHDNFRMSKHTMMKLGRCIVQKSRPSSNLWVIVPRVRTSKNVTFDYDVVKIIACCLVSKCLHVTTATVRYSMVLCVTRVSVNIIIRLIDVGLHQCAWPPRLTTLELALQTLHGLSSIIRELSRHQAVFSIYWQQSISST